MDGVQFIGAFDGLLGNADAQRFAVMGLRILAAMVLGGLIGWEREGHGRPAGLRTHLLLCVGCALTMLVSQYMTEKFSAMAALAGGLEGMRSDPARIAAHVMSGIGFLGGGVILKVGASVRGLTTAACLWVTAAIGLALGAGYWAPPIITFAVVMFALLALGRWEKRMPQRDSYTNLKLTFARAGEYVENVRSLLAQHALEVLTYTMSRDKDRVAYTLNIRSRQPAPFDRLSAVLMEELSGQGLEELRWE